MTVAIQIDHPFLRGKRGVCIAPVVGNGHYKPCGKMAVLHRDYGMVKPS